MYRYFLYIYDYLASHRWWATVLLLLLLALMGVLSFQVKYEEDISKFLPQDPKREKFQEVYQQISAQEKIAVIFTSADSTHVVGDDTLERAMPAKANSQPKNKEPLIQKRSCSRR